MMICEIKQPTIVGRWEMWPGCFWELTSMPGWRARFAARWLLGWKWTDA